MLKLILTAIACCGLLHGCASDNAEIVAKDGTTISQIKITHNGDTEKSRPYMAGICKGFLLSKHEVQDFFVYADHVNLSKSNDSYDRLPCYASGTALINNQPYHWVIRSGGVGLFTNKNHRFMKICGKGCCSKVSGVC
jgi:hypothetical protein